MFIHLKLSRINLLVSSCYDKRLEFISKNTVTIFVIATFYVFKDEDSDCDGQKSYYNTTKPLLDNSSLGNRSSDSSENSETSSGRLCLALDQAHLVDGDSEAAEDQLLLSWNTHKKYKGDDIRKPRPNLLRQTLVNVQSQEIVL